MSNETKHEHTHDEDSGKHGSKSGSLHCVLSLLSCEEYSKLASKKLDEPLTKWESITYSFHKIMCMVCRRFERQILAINGAAKFYSNDLNDTQSKVHLSSQAKGRMQEKLNQELN